METRGESINLLEQRAFSDPQADYVVFYSITFEGVRSYKALEDDLSIDKDELSYLFFSAHSVIAELRKVEEKSIMNKDGL